MSDLIYLALVVAFFVTCAGFVRACERIIGPDEAATGRDADPTTEPVAEPVEVPA